MTNTKHHTRMARIDPVRAGGEINRGEALRRLRLGLCLRGRLLAAEGGLRVGRALRTHARR